MFVDASAIVAILLKETGATDLTNQIDAASDPVTSTLAVFEAVTAISREAGLSVEDAERQGRGVMTISRIVLVPVAEAEVNGALVAYARYGKGRGHPARLNLGDCFSYACAAVRGLPLLFVGNDFSRTTLPPTI